MGGDARMRTVFEGIAWAVEQGANIINMSLGFDYYEHHFGLEVERVWQAGGMPVAAIGNENHGSTSYPGNLHNALAVGAVERGGRRTEVAFFSSGASLVFPGRATAQSPASRR
jgi:subtilisin family serine protease